MKGKKDKSKGLLPGVAVTVVAIAGITIGIVFSTSSNNKKISGGRQIAVGNETITVSQEDYERWQEEEKKVRENFSGDKESLDGYIEMMKADFFGSYFENGNIDIQKMSNLEAARLGGVYLCERIKEKGTDKQKEKLESFVEGAYVYPRQILIMTGDISEDSGRLTLKEAENICQYFNPDKDTTSVDEIEYILSSYFNRYSLVCDKDGGSGMDRREYWLTDDGNELIRIMCGAVVYVKDGEAVKTLYGI